MCYQSSFTDHSKDRFIEQQAQNYKDLETGKLTPREYAKQVDRANKGVKHC